MTIDESQYELPQFHVEKRLSLPAPVTAAIDPFRDGYRRSDLSGEARLWTRIHNGLLGASARLPQWCEQLLSGDSMPDLLPVAGEVLGLGSQLVQHAHAHHHIEDDHFFPIFLQRFPRLQDPIDLLERDHDVLSSVLDDMEQAIRRLHLATGNENGRDAILKAAEGLNAVAMRLDRLFIRHIGDEEEICLPVLVRFEDPS